jgi:hypothetical protein
VTVAYDALVANHAPKPILLAEIQPAEALGVWTAAGGGLTNTYYVSWNRQFGTSIVTGGIYRQLDSVRQNATSLTSRASAALVDANLGSYFHDTATNRIYVSTTTGASPNTFASIRAYFTVRVCDTSVEFSDQPLYWPLLTGSLPTFSEAFADMVFGVTQSGTGTISLLNGDGLWDRLARQWLWRNKIITLKLGGTYRQGTTETALAYTDFATMGTLRINTVAPNDETFDIQVESVGNILNQSLPQEVWADDDIMSQWVAAEEQQKPIPILLGSVEFCPMTETNQVGDTWITHNPYVNTSVSVGLIHAVDRTSGEYIALVDGVDYVTAGPGVAGILYTMLTYNSDTHFFVANLQDTDETTYLPGTFARRLLELCGESAANIDTAAFDALDVARPQLVGHWLNTPTPAIDLMRQLEQSVNAQVYWGPSGWTCRHIDFSAPADWTLTDADFSKWAPTDDLQGVLSRARVGYLRHPVTGAYSEASDSSDRTQYESETSDSHTVNTFLQQAADAAAQAGHLRFLKGAPGALIEFEVTGLTLMTAHVGDLVAVTRDRAPCARNGRYDGQLLLLVALTKALGPEGPVVSGVLSDLGGNADKVFRLAPSGSSLTWSTATAAEKAFYGFLGDTNRYIDSNDAVTRDGKVLV